MKEQKKELIEEIIKEKRDAINAVLTEVREATVVSKEDMTSWDDFFGKYFGDEYFDGCTSWLKSEGIEELQDKLDTWKNPQTRQAAAKKIVKLAVDLAAIA